MFTDGPAQPRAQLCALFTLGLAVLICGAVSSPSTAHALSCNGRLVEVGDTAVEARARCGEPTSISTRTETRTSSAYYSYGGRGMPGPVYGQTYSVTVTIETWVYDFGPTRFMEQITVENGVIVRMEPLGYGTREGSSRRRR